MQSEEPEFPKCSHDRCCNDGTGTTRFLRSCCGECVKAFYCGRNYHLDGNRRAQGSLRKLGSLEVRVRGEMWCLGEWQPGCCHTLCLCIVAAAAAALMCHLVSLGEYSRTIILAVLRCVHFCECSQQPTPLVNLSAIRIYALWHWFPQLPGHPVPHLPKLINADVVVAGGGGDAPLHGPIAFLLMEAGTWGRGLFDGPRGKTK